VSRTMGESGKFRRPGSAVWPFVVLALLVAVGIALDSLGVIDREQWLDWARSHAGDWRLPAGLVLIQVALFTFALPGSTLVWVAAPLYPAPAAALILTTGGTVGAATAYLFARRLARTEEHPLHRLLRARGDFLTLSAVRLLPGVPHSLINYGAGSLRLPLARFLAATALALSVKTLLYSSAIREVVDSASPSDLLRPATLLPLVGLALLLLLGRFAKARWLDTRD
jgi:uncharacterized membrane protein YdjX (TVP38/TMEM64 family)